MTNLIDKLLSNKDLEKKVLFFYKNFKLVSTLSINELMEKARLIASKIKANEITDSNIILSFENEENFVTYFFGIILSGNVPVPMASNALMLKDDYQELLFQFSSAAQTKYIAAKNSPEGFTNIAKFNDVEMAAQFANPESRETCFIQFSSGSTSSPKGVVISHSNLLANNDQINQGIKLRESDSICTWLPLHHDMGLIGSLLTALLKNLECHIIRTQDYVIAPHKWLHLVSETKCSALCIPNSAYYVCATKIPEKKLQGLDLSHIRFAQCGAEPIKANVLKAFSKRFEKYGFSANAIMPVYGLAEATLAVTFHEVGTKFETLTLKNEEFISCGKVLSPTQLEIRNQDQGIGEIYIKGPSISTHYFGRKSHLENGWLNTGDLGFLDKEGKLYVTGRSKDLIICNGVNIFANDLEFLAAKVPAVKLGRMVAFSIQTDKSELPHLIIELNEKSKEARKRVKQDVVNALKSKISLSEDNISIVPELTLKKTTSGKVKRQSAQKRYMAGEITKIEKNYRFNLIVSRYIKNKFKFNFLIKEKLG
ncbi:AMP-binding enzyme [Bacteriovorax sp. BAL6_X]|uniref:AMP-binding protein n=1 Tax=Bacteriovorax sp. BAL6_X TaxID=1201290 RepID=UPI000385F041|nr:AMP-binding protein [Bacteriovorax sp. BAL6_X]EPZ49329.1 AMP-binding enzyme [Bacteriovorax sp. BAL6_X]